MLINAIILNLHCITTIMNTNNIKQYVSVLFLILILLASNSMAQDSISKKPVVGFKKNALTVSVGMLNEAGIIGIEYERILIGGNNNSYFKLLIRPGVAMVFQTGGFFSIYIAQTHWLYGGFLTGKKNSHMEIAIGYVSFSDSGFYDSNLGFELGYRFQKPGEKFLFRIGSGMPTILFVSIGISFK